MPPPPLKVDDLWAVPVDISRILAKLSFDGSSLSGNGEATIEFKVGRYTGNPIFDLRQTITSAELDGSPVLPSKMGAHDCGGGPNAMVRVLEKVLAAGTSHTLHLVYTLEKPQAPSGGSYPPALKWTSGPSLDFNFGFTDLSPGRYLEAWIPANLIYDQFELTLEIEIKNSPVSHAIITNGTCVPSGQNHWTVTFPSRFTALSPLLEIHPESTLVSMTGTVTLPVSGKTVTIEVWKFISGDSDLPTELNHIKTWLTDNELTGGPFIHGDRFVVLLHVGGMEYDGGTTSAPYALFHETFHCWWARGVKPVSQPDAWIDEGLAEYHDDGSAISTPFDFTRPPDILCSRKPYERITVSTAYSKGCEFWEGIAALIGTSTFNSLMKEYYQAYRGKFYTTLSVEEFLLGRTGNPLVVDAFHRFVYGFNDVSPSPDLWLRDAPLHTGTDNWGGEFWNSPDLWVRNSDDGGLTHQDPRYNRDNWIYARVRNQGSSIADHFVVTFNVKSYAGVEFIYPGDFVPSTLAASGFNIRPNESVIVKTKWPAELVPSAGTHSCLLAAVYSRGYHPESNRHVWEQKSLVQKNLTIVELHARDWIIIPFVVSNLEITGPHQRMLEIVRPVGQERVETSLIHRSMNVYVRSSAVHVTRLEPEQILPGTFKGEFLDCGRRVRKEYGKPGWNRVITSENRIGQPVLFQKGYEAIFSPGLTAQIPIVVRPKDQLFFGLRIKIPETAEKGQVLNLDLVQRDAWSQQIRGGLAVEIHVI